jgi:hypothetical protein
MELASCRNMTTTSVDHRVETQMRLEPRYVVIYIFYSTYRYLRLRVMGMGTLNTGRTTLTVGARDARYVLIFIFLNLLMDNLDY